MDGENEEDVFNLSLENEQMVTNEVRQRNNGRFLELLVLKVDLQGESIVLVNACLLRMTLTMYLVSLLPPSVQNSMIFVPKITLVLYM